MNGWQGADARCTSCHSNLRIVLRRSAGVIPRRMKDTMKPDTIMIEENTSALSTPTPPSSLALLPAKAQGLLLRMFANPYLLEQDERAGLIVQLRECVAAQPKVSELRVLLGMALCVNLDVQAAIE